MPQSSDITCVISRDAQGTAGVRAGFENALVDALRCRADKLLVIPHLYDLRPSHSATAALLDARGELAVASWLHPRAAFWTLRALGIAGAPHAATGPAAERMIRCFNMSDFASVADCAAALAADSARTHAATVKEIAETATPRWYPVLDGSRCISCRKCVDFCLFGVYALADDEVVVVQPDHCKNGCPACARACPQRAIMFPHYFADAAIAGASGGQAGAETPGVAPPPFAANRPPDELDRLITTLEELDS